MTSWTLKGTLLELCNCVPGCDCNFRGRPNSEEGNCEALVCHLIRDGRFGDLDMSGVNFVMAYWWPGAIHEKGGKARGYVDGASDEQFEALARIIRGEEGHEFFEIFNSTYDEPPVVERAPIDVTSAGGESRFSVGDIASGRMTPLRNPVTGDVNQVRIVKEHGMIWRDGQVAQSEQLSVAVPGISFEHSGRHAVVADFDWSVG